VSRWIVVASASASIAMFGVMLRVATAGPINKNVPPPPPQEAAKPSPPGPDDPRRTVAVLDVAVNGVPNEVKEQFQASLDAQVDPKRFWIAPRARIRELMANSTKWTEGCVVGACLAEVKVQTHADLVLLVALNGSGTSFGSVVTLVRTDSGHVLSQESERCDVCTVNEALTTATLATIRLLNAVPDKLPDDAADHRAAADATGAAGAELRKHDHRRVTIAKTVTAAGVALAVIGAVIYVADGHSHFGVATATAGVGLAAGGVVVLTF
jgi:hypothetical protein